MAILTSRNSVDFVPEVIGRKHGSAIHLPFAASAVCAWGSRTLNPTAECKWLYINVLRLPSHCTSRYLSA